MSVPDLDQLNLDAMDHEDLMELSEALWQLHVYAKTKAIAMTLRTTGMIAGALRLEDEADAAYAKLPENWRW